MPPNLLSVHLFKLQIPRNVNLLTIYPSLKWKNDACYVNLRWNDEYDDYDLILNGEIIRLSAIEVVLHLFNSASLISITLLRAPHLVFHSWTNFVLFLSLTSSKVTLLILETQLLKCDDVKTNFFFFSPDFLFTICETMNIVKNHSVNLSDFNFPWFSSFLTQNNAHCFSYLPLGSCMAAKLGR
jgi:hypothetical protein